MNILTPLGGEAAVGALGLPAAAAVSNDSWYDAKGQQQAARNPRTARRAVLYLTFLHTHSN